MAMPVVGFDIFVSGASGNPTFTIPAGTPAGSAVVVELYLEGNTAPTVTQTAGPTMTGFPGNNYTNTGSNPDMHVRAFWLRTQAADAGVDIVFTVSANWRGGLLGCWQNGKSSGLLSPNPTASTATAASASHVAPDITPGAQPHLELVIVGAFAGAVWTVPTGMTELAESENVYMAYLYRTTTAAPGTRTASGSNTQYKAIHALLLEETDGGVVIVAPPVSMQLV